MRKRPGCNGRFPALRLWSLSRHPAVGLNDVQRRAREHGGFRGRGRSAENRLARVASGALRESVLTPEDRAAVEAALADLGVPIDDPFAPLSPEEQRAIRHSPAMIGCRRPVKTGITCFRRFKAAEHDSWKRSTRMPLTDEQIHRFGLARDPFDRPRSMDELYSNTDLQRKAAELRSELKKCSYVWLVGPSGSGKTQLARGVLYAMEQKDRLAVSRMRSPNTRRISENSLIVGMCMDFERHVTPGADWPSAAKGVEFATRRLVRVVDKLWQSGRRPCMVIEEAHGVADQIMIAIKRIQEAVVEGYQERLAALLIGQNDSSASLTGRSLDDVLADPDMREIARRVHTIHMRPLGRTTRSYIEHRVGVAGGDAGRIFEADVYPAITRNLPRDLLVPQAVDSLLTRAMARADELGLSAVTARCVDDVAIRTPPPADD